MPVPCFPKKGLNYYKKTFDCPEIRCFSKKMRPSLSIKNIFLDRDGVIIKDMNYLSDPEKIAFIPGAVETMRLMQEFGISIFVVTNQSGIGRKYFTEHSYYRVENRLTCILKQNGIVLSGTAFCPHRPDEMCCCRKPASGMWHKLSEHHSLEASQSIIIGDKQSDIEFGINCGFKASVLVLTGHGKKYLKNMEIIQKPDKWFEPEPKPSGPSAVARDISAAWSWIEQRFLP